MGPVSSSSKTVFIDFDGTYAHAGSPPPAHQDAVRAARAGGHRVFLCTGRPRSMLAPEILEVGFDGIVAAAGGYVELGGDQPEVVHDVRFPADLAASVVALLDEHRVEYVLEAPEAVYCRPATRTRLLDWLAANSLVDDHLVSVLTSVQDPASVAFGKVTCFDSPLPVGQLADRLGPRVGALPSSLPERATSAGEIYQVGVHKAVGMEVVMQRLGLLREDVIGIGDGLNDLEMLELAGVAVAIEGADDAVLAVADLVVPTPERDGLATAFTRLGLI